MVRHISHELYNPDESADFYCSNHEEDHADVLGSGLVDAFETLKKICRKVDDEEKTTVLTMG